MATIESRGKGYRVRWRDLDGTSRCRQCPTHAVAKELKREVEAASALGRRWEPAVPEAAPLLRDLIAAYIVDLKRTHQPRTVIRAHAALRPWLRWMQGHTGLVGVGVDALTRETVAAHDGHLVARKLGVASRRTTAWAIGACWRWGWTHPDWKRHLAEPSMPRMPPQELRLVRAPTWDQLDVVVEECLRESYRVATRTWLYRLAMMLRGLGWRVSQVIGTDWDFVDLEAGTITLDGRLGKRGQERRGRTVILPAWLRQEMGTWGRREGPVIGHRPEQRTASDFMSAAWRRTSAPSALYVQRPDHAFRIGLVSELARARIDREAVEYYVGHAQGIRGHYVDPSALPLGEVAAAIPAPSCVRVVAKPRVQSLDEARGKRP